MWHWNTATSTPVYMYGSRLCSEGTAFVAALAFPVNVRGYSLYKSIPRKTMQALPQRAEGASSAKCILQRFPWGRKLNSLVPLESNIWQFWDFSSTAVSVSLWKCSWMVPVPISQTNNYSVEHCWLSRWDPKEKLSLGWALPCRSQWWTLLSVDRCCSTEQKEIQYSWGEREKARSCVSISQWC